jgi:ribonuclease Z
MGLAVGPWLRGFKEAILKGLADSTPIDVTWELGGAERATTLPLGQLKQEIMQVTSGRKIVYVVDCAFTNSNIEKIIRLTQSADILFIEATFLDADAAAAEQRRHLTARQAGTLARLASVKRLVTLHYSPRYRGQAYLLDQEAQQAFSNPRPSA